MLRLVWHLVDSGFLQCLGCRCNTSHCLHFLCLRSWDLLSAMLTSTWGFYIFVVLLIYRVCGGGWWLLSFVGASFGSAGRFLWTSGPFVRSCLSCFVGCPFFPSGCCCCSYLHRLYSSSLTFLWPEAKFRSALGRLSTLRIFKSILFFTLTMAKARSML